MSNIELRRPDHPPGQFINSLRPPGECQLTLQDGRIFVVRADEHVWLEDDFLCHLAAEQRKGNPQVSLVFHPCDSCDPTSCCQRLRGGNGPRCFAGTSVIIWGVNEHVMYRVGTYRRRIGAEGCWEATRWA